MRRKGMLDHLFVMSLYTAGAADSINPNNNQTFSIMKIMEGYLL